MIRLHEAFGAFDMTYLQYQMLLKFVLISWPFLLASPLVFLIGKVRNKIALRVTAIMVVCGSYLMLLMIAVPAFIGAWTMAVADDPATNFVAIVIDQDQMFGGIRFPKGSTVRRDRFEGKISDVVPSEDIEINGIPAGKGTTVWFGPDGKVGYLTTGRTWIYRGISVPAGSTVFMGTSGRASARPSAATSAAPRKKNGRGIYAIDISQPSDATLNVEGMLVHGSAVLNFNGDTLISLYGSYVWHGNRYKSYIAGVDGQIARRR